MIIIIITAKGSGKVFANGKKPKYFHFNILQLIKDNYQPLPKGISPNSLAWRQVESSFISTAPAVLSPFLAALANVVVIFWHRPSNEHGTQSLA